MYGHPAKGILSFFVLEMLIILFYSRWYVLYRYQDNIHIKPIRSHQLLHTTQVIINVNVHNKTQSQRTINICIFIARKRNSYITYYLFCFCVCFWMDEFNKRGVDCGCLVGGDQMHVIHTLIFHNSNRTQLLSSILLYNSLAI